MLPSTPGSLDTCEEVSLNSLVAAVGGGAPCDLYLTLSLSLTLNNRPFGATAGGLLLALLLDPRRHGSSIHRRLLPLKFREHKALIAIDRSIDRLANHRCLIRECVLYVWYWVSISDWERRLLCGWWCRCDARLGEINGLWNWREWVRV